MSNNPLVFRKKKISRKLIFFKFCHININLPDIVFKPVNFYCSERET